MPIADFWWATAAWGDFDNDNDLDLLVNGRTANNASDTRLYRNEGSNVWTRITNGVPTGWQAAIAVAAISVLVRAFFMPTSARSWPVVASIKLATPLPLVSSR